ncbi:hypothetical protein GCM10010421_10530 [Streptomyces glaucus]|uniref:FAD/NAD(P)-binding domain-containing protein n=1 Tax=Streptomyces glaucus TaxID=284029 RepID=A0ABN3JA17_9ACTN
MSPLTQPAQVRGVIVIGSGPAGYTARAQLNPLLFGSSIFVGKSLTTTTEVENFPDFPESVDGPVLMENMRAQAERFGAEMIDDDTVDADLTGGVKLLTDSAGTVHRARTAIVATGSGHRKLCLPNEDELSGRGPSWCATCDGFFFRDRGIVATGSDHRKLRLPNEDELSGRGPSWCATCDGFFFRDHGIVVAGDGDTAVEEAAFLTRFAKPVTVVHRRPTLRASKIMQDRAFSGDRTSFALDSEIAEIAETTTTPGA